MLHSFSESSRAWMCFDLAPTGALCYIIAGGDARTNPVLISLPQERCATVPVADVVRTTSF